MRTYNVSLEQCLNHVVKARPCVLPNDGFLKQLILYDRFLVERRRQRQETSAPKPTTESNNTEIPISIVPAQDTANETNKTSTIQSSVSADAIHVIPIQVSPQVYTPEKVLWIVRVMEIHFRCRFKQHLKKQSRWKKLKYN